MLLFEPEIENLVATAIAYNVGSSVADQTHVSEMLTTFITRSIPLGLQEPILVDGLSLPRYWATVWSSLSLGTLYSSKVSVDKVEAFVTKARDVNANKAVLISSKGFQSGCFPVAERHGIQLLILSETTDTSIPELVERFTPGLNIYDVGFRTSQSGDLIEFEDWGGRLGDLPLGYDSPIRPGQFYELPSMFNRYYCEKIEGDLITWTLVESYQHGHLFQATFAQKIKYSSHYVQVTDSKILVRLKEMLARLKANK